MRDPERGRHRTRQAPVDEQRVLGALVGAIARGVVAVVDLGIPGAQRRFHRRRELVAEARAEAQLFLVARLHVEVLRIGDHAEVQRATLAEAVVAVAEVEASTLDHVDHVEVAVVRSEIVADQAAATETDTRVGEFVDGGQAEAMPTGGELPRGLCHEAVRVASAVLAFGVVRAQRNRVATAREPHRVGAEDTLELELVVRAVELRLHVLVVQRQRVGLAAQVLPRHPALQALVVAVARAATDRAVGVVERHVEEHRVEYQIVHRTHACHEGRPRRDHVTDLLVVADIGLARVLQLLGAVVTQVPLQPVRKDMPGQRGAPADHHVLRGRIVLVVGELRVVAHVGLERSPRAPIAKIQVSVFLHLGTLEHRTAVGVVGVLRAHAEHDCRAVPGLDGAGHRGRHQQRRPDDALHESSEVTSARAHNHEIPTYGAGSRLITTPARRSRPMASAAARRRLVLTPP
ncbi:MAG: hypothetical protein CALGDGBN_00666 [Pseudomonadales bacterium]|nr:hypothetical protein [Pseudomonadales bacterium]